MKNYSIQDSHNNNKVWLIKVYANNIYYNQTVNGIKVYSRFTRTTKTWINEILNININTRLSEEDEQTVIYESYLNDDSYWEEQRQIDNDVFAIQEELQNELNVLP